MKKILIVEDNLKIAAALSVRLKQAGYDVLTAADGRQGLKVAVVARPDLIVSEIWMPAPIGFLTKDRLLNLGLADVPVIYITASKQEDLKTIALEEGAAGFFEKPYDANELLAFIAQALPAEPAVAARAE
jgi:DNA-binding response OmpR family regulator